MSRDSVNMYTKANDTYADNIGAVGVIGHKRTDNIFIGSSISNLTYVRGSTRNTNDIQGALLTTNVKSDVAIEGAGMMLVTDSVGGTPAFTRRGDFRQDESGFWKNGAGQLLLAWQLDDQGNLPANSAITDSLTPVNFSNTKGTPKATTIVTPTLNLDPRQNALLGANVIAKMNPTSLNANTGATNATDIILPDYISTGGISIGDQFTFTASSAQQPKILNYGGIAVANAPSIATPILGATTSTTTFTFGVAPNQVPPNATLQLNLGGTIYNFTAAQANPNIQNKTFNTIASLAAAINAVKGLSSTIDTKGRLYIAPTDSTQSLTFTDTNAGTFVSALGLVNIPAAPNNATANTYRFNSLASLDKAINDQSTVYELKATITGGSIQIGSLLATDSFTITGTSLGVNKFTSMTLNPAGTEQGRATVAISAPGNNLQVGDMIRINGTGYAGTPDGIYAVTSSNSNAFTVSLINNNPANFPAAAPAANQLTAGATWQKVPGQTFAPVVLAPAAIVAGGGGNVTINSGGHTLVANDVIYISGAGLGLTAGGQDVSIPDGYYRVTVPVVAGSFNIIPASNVGGGGVIPPFASNFSYQKVGSVVVAGGGGPAAFGADGLGTFNANVMVTTGNNGSSTVRLFTTSNNYNPNDWITLRSLPAAGLVVDGITVNNNTPYLVTNQTANYIDFTVPGGVATTGDGVTGMQTYGIPGAAPIQIDNISRTMNYLGINEIGSQLVNGVLTPTNSIYAPTYDFNNANTSLSSNTAFPTSSKFQAPIKLYDSLGGEYNIILNFAKLNNDLWAVEATAQVGADGVTYDIIQARAGDGFIQAGTLSFDTNGKLIGTPTLNSLSISRTNGSAPSVIKIDWANQLSTIKSGAVTQYVSAYDLQPPQQDGQSSGTMVDYSVADDGTITAVFDSGETKKLWQIPMGIVANVNGLEAGLNGTFSITSESGDLILKAAGVGGSGKFISMAVEDSNTDITSELLKVQDLTNVIRTNARVVGTNSKNFATILQELA